MVLTSGMEGAGKDVDNWADVVLQKKSDMDQSEKRNLHESKREACLAQQQP